MKITLGYPSELSKYIIPARPEKLAPLGSHARDLGLRYPAAWVPPLLSWFLAPKYLLARK